MLSPLLAQLAAPATSQPAAPPWLQMLQSFGPFVIIIVVFLLLSGGSKRKTDRERKSLLEGLKKGDRIKLIGGEYGVVVDLKETRVQVKVDESANTKIWYARDAVQGVEKEEPTAAK